MTTPHIVVPCALYKRQAKRVVDLFGSAPPDRPLLCFLDPGDDQPHGTVSARAAFYPPGPNGVLSADLPNAVRHHLVTNHGRAHLCVVYLHGRACSPEIALTLSLAHELQHFVQYTTRLRWWAANNLALRTLRNHLDELELLACNFPHERDARTVSKRVTENLFGHDAVAEYISGVISRADDRDDRRDWPDLLTIDSSVPYDLIQETTRFFPRFGKYGDKLRKEFAAMAERDPDFSGIDIDQLLRGAPQ